MSEKLGQIDAQHIEVESNDVADGTVYEDAEHEPKLHWKTYVALASMCMIGFVQLTSLLGPPTALTFIANDLSGSSWKNWVINVTTLAQAALGPTIASASDTFHSRKLFLVAGSTMAVVGSAIAPGSQSVSRLIGAQMMVGLGIAVAPLSYAIPSEILPRKWRPVGQGILNMTSSLGALLGPIIIGSLLQKSVQGWRTFYWIQTGFWAVGTIGVFIGYRPLPKPLHVQEPSFVKKVLALDLIGAAILTSGITLTIAGINLGGDLYPWHSSTVLAPLIIGIVALISFAAYETWGTKTGIFPHELFQEKMGRGFVISCFLFFLEGAMFFATAIWYPVLVGVLFTSEPLQHAVYFIPAIAPSLVLSMVYGAVSAKVKSVRWPLLVGFTFWTAGLIGQSTIEPGKSATALATLTLVGLGLAGPLPLIIAGTHLSVPSHLLGTASAAVVSMRAFGVTIFTAVYSSTVSSRLNVLIPKDIAGAVLPLRLPPTSLGPFIAALSSDDAAALMKVPGVTPEIIGAGVAALQQAFADGIRIVFIIAACFGALACVLCCALPSVRKNMDFIVSAPVERLHAKNEEQK